MSGHVFLRITLVMVVGEITKTKKLSPRYFGPFQILKNFGTTAYKVALPPNLEIIHVVFHVSQLKKYLPDLSHVIEHKNVHLQGNMTYEFNPDRMIDT